MAPVWVVIGFSGWSGLPGMWLTESLDVQGELLLVLDERIDLESVWCGSTLGIAALCTGNDDVGHGGCKLEVVES